VVSDTTPQRDPHDPATSQQHRPGDQQAGADPYEQVVAMTRAAHDLTLQGEYAEAHAVLDDLSPTSDEVAVRIVLERGRLLLAEGRPDEARPQLEAASQTASAARLDALRTEALALLATLDA
jgi:predicted negative regulator of RcsB-dependent stress response